MKIKKHLNLIFFIIGSLLGILSICLMFYINKIYGGRAGEMEITGLIAVMAKHDPAMFLLWGSGLISNLLLTVCAVNTTFDLQQKKQNKIKVKWYKKLPAFGSVLAIAAIMAFMQSEFIISLDVIGGLITYFYLLRNAPLTKQEQQKYEQMIDQINQRKLAKDKKKAAHHHGN